MRRKKSNKEPSFTIMHLALIMLCGVLITTHSTGRLYAKYKSEVSGSDEARVAYFEVNQDLTVIKSNGREESKTINSFVVDDTLTPGESTTYVFSVENKSEVAVKFTVSGRTVYGELPLTLKTEEVDMMPGESKTIRFQVLWDDQTASKTSVDYCGKIDMIEIFVTVSQID